MTDDAPDAPPGGAGWRQVTIPAARLDGWLERFAARHGAFETRAVAAGVQLSAPDGQRAVLAAPFPDADADADAADAGADEADADADAAAADPLALLRASVAVPRAVGVLLIRRGGYAIGVYAGARLVASKVGGAYVQGTTKAGGWSQQRYARRRDNQTRAIVAKAVEDAVRVLGGRPGGAAGLDAALAGGDRALIRAALDDPRLSGFAERLREPVLAVGDPRLATLQQLTDQVGAVRVSLLP
ncbi:MAG: hypothetical protein LBQ06_01055 [Frankiaceae bacterium]|jgi:hypothetical protein|nr:hypothetical protein [Frankiaceae bacterium]